MTLAERRRAAKMTQKRLAEAAGVARETIARIESGDRYPFAYCSKTTLVFPMLDRCFGANPPALKRKSD